jgi:hypothetical protein
VGFFIAVLWVLFVGSVRRNEMIVGVATLVLLSASLSAIRRAEMLHLRFQLTDIIQSWRIPAYLAARNVEIAKVLFDDLFGSGGAGSFYRVTGFKSAKSNSILSAREVLVTLYTTVAPNFIVIGIVRHPSRMLFHQIERTNVSEMTKALGAHVGVKLP